jgi:putative hydrolase of the HAD superfamily
MPAVRAALLDVGGIFHLPDHDHVIGAFARAEVTVDAAVLDRAHYAGTTGFPMDYTGELPWDEMWAAYLEAYADECGVPDDRRADTLEHLHQEFTTAALWTRLVPGSAEALRALDATGVAIGIVSNADGSVAERLRQQEVLQVGPGLGVQVETVIDSGVVGVTKPDPRIFHLALDALGVQPDDAIYVGDMPAIDVVGARKAGIRPVLMDPYGLHNGIDCERVTSLHDVAALVTDGLQDPRQTEPPQSTTDGGMRR